MPTQNHIHLGTTLGAGPEKAPTPTYRVTQRIPNYNGDVDIARGATGKLFVNHRHTAEGAPLILCDFDYVLNVTNDEIETLSQLLYQPVYLVDNVHPNDGQDHTSAVRSMVMTALKYSRNLDPGLNTNYVGITLMDNSA